jgi:hypothetical protein
MLAKLGPGFAWEGQDMHLGGLSTRTVLLSHTFTRLSGFSSVHNTNWYSSSWIIYSTFGSEYRFPFCNIRNLHHHADLKPMQGADVIGGPRDFERSRSSGRFHDSHYCR